MQVTPTTVYLGVGTGTSASSTSNFLAYAPRSGGVRADANDAYQGPVNGYAAVAIGEAVFAVDDSSTTGTAARLHRILDASGVYGAVAWDTGTSYPAYSIRSIAFDGTDLWLVSYATTTSHQTRVWRVSATTPGPLTVVGDIPGIDRVVGIALDSTYMYLAATGSGSGGVFRLALTDVGPTTPTPDPHRDARAADDVHRRRARRRGGAPQPVRARLGGGARRDSPGERHAARPRAARRRDGLGPTHGARPGHGRALPHPDQQH
ncbi:MAG: hypothetical protein M5U28_02710 [Sandaracinaceae bacterium]|nr:hypothetical protein [Sandaracinaceae bacterium]